MGVQHTTYRPPTNTTQPQPHLPLSLTTPSRRFALNPVSPLRFAIILGLDTRQPPAPIATMAERSLSQILTQLKGNPSMSYTDANALLSKAKLALLNLKSLAPSSSFSLSTSSLPLVCL